jgi:SAM-dependent methyltransferase
MSGPGEVSLRANLLEQRLLESLLTGPDLSRTLEIGSGDGRLLIPLARRSSRSVGIDVDLERMGALRDRLLSEGTSAELVRADGRRLPFSDGSFTTVLLIRLLHRFSDPVRVLREIRRILTDRGTLLLSAVIRPSLRTLAWDLSASIGSPGSTDRVSFSRAEIAVVHSRTAPGYLMTRAGTIRVLGSAGFEVDRILASGWDLLPGFRSLAPSSLLRVDAALSRAPFAPTYFFTARPRQATSR